MCYYEIKIEIVRFKYSYFKKERIQMKLKQIVFLSILLTTSTAIFAVQINDFASLFSNPSYTITGGTLSYPTNLNVQQVFYSVNVNENSDTFTTIAKAIEKDINNQITEKYKLKELIMLDTNNTPINLLNPQFINSTLVSKNINLYSNSIRPIVTVAVRASSPS